MLKRVPQRDPIRAYQRKATAQRRVGENAQCACGEKRPEALIRNNNLTICAACTRKREGKTTMDKHHVAGKSNHPATIEVPVNDHRARLSVAQHDWPKESLENPDRSPLLRAAACIRGFIDTLIYLVETFLHWIAAMLETLDIFLVEKFGQKWWIDTPLARFTMGEATNE